ncbi:39S ribosomal protein L53, mitochondrial, partial [Clarias magur]
MVRDFLVLVGSEKARATNMNCEVKAEVKHDQSEPVIDITFMDGERLVMKGAKLTSQEMLSALQTRCIAKDPQAKATAKKDFLVLVGSEKARATNMNCEVKAEVKHDQSEPVIDITF